MMMYDGWGYHRVVFSTPSVELGWLAADDAGDDRVLGRRDHRRGAAVRYLADSRHPGGGPPTPGPARAEDLLAERFARGEIDDDEYRQRLTLLRDQR